MLELKNALGSNSSVTIFRKLKGLDYIFSCSHSGKYYSLKRIARFNSKGLWVFKSVLFSILNICKVYRGHNIWQLRIELNVET